jgi:hypothetical protein
MNKLQEVRQEFARAAEAVKVLPSWMQELGQQGARVKKQPGISKIEKASNPRPAKKRRK